MKTLLWFTIGALYSASPAFARGIDIQLTPHSAPGVPTASVQIDLTIEDTGGASDCTSFALRRRAVYPCDRSAPQVIQCIPRQPGTRTLQFYDNVALDTTYLYDVVGYGPSFAPPGTCLFFLSDQHTFQQVFDPHGWAFPILAWTTVGPDPTPIAHGRLLPPVDASANFALESCSDGCPDAWQGYAGPEVLQYIGTDTELLLYGNVSYCCNCCGWLFDITSAVPQPCVPLAVQPRTWSNFKRLYR